MAAQGILVLGENKASILWACEPVPCRELIDTLQSLHEILRRLECKIVRHQMVLPADKCECDFFDCGENSKQNLGFWIIKLRTTYGQFHAKYLELVLADCRHPQKIQAISKFGPLLQEYSALIASHPVGSHELTNLPPAGAVVWNNI